MIRFDGRAVVVTGAGKGLGRAHAETLAARGACVLVNNRAHPGDGVPAAEQVAQAIRDAGGKAVANLEAVEAPGAGVRIIEAALAAFGRVDVVIANAGVSAPVSFHREPLSDVRTLIEINLFGALGLVHAALPHLRAQRYGRVIVTTSSAALYGDAGFVSYGTAKAALIGFTTSLAQESERAGITVNAVLPFAHTPMTAALFGGGFVAGAAADVMGPAPVAELVAWLASEGCRRTGEIWIAGGRVVRRAAVVLGQGIVSDTEITAERLAALELEAAGLERAIDYSSGGAMLAEMAEQTLAITRRGAAT
jgi:NAD(P)-dependent dehydrogenase (short-subunit alcohol dehydrogenase family)